MNAFWHRPRVALVLLVPLLAIGIGLGLSVSSPSRHPGPIASSTTDTSKSAGRQSSMGQTSHGRPIIGMGRPGRGFVADHVTAIGDSVMVDYEDILKQDIPGIAVDASVGLQFETGISQLAQLRNEGRLGATVVVGLGTNGPITPSLMSQMLNVLKGASRVIFVTNHVDLPWQNPNNALILATANSHAHIVVANWAARARSHPQWFYSDQTHLPIDGPGARELAWIVRQAIRRP